MQIKMCDDTNRFYILLENPTNEDKLKALDLVQKLFKIEDAKKEVERPIGIIPNKIEDVSVPESAKEVKSKSDLIKKGTESRYIDKITTPEKVVEYYLQYDIFDKATQNWISIRSAAYMKEYLSKITGEDVGSMKKFLTDFYPILTTSISGILKQKGYTSLTGFLNTASEQEIISVFNNSKSKINKELKIKK
jgi:hypothetical protein